VVHNVPRQNTTFDPQMSGKDAPMKKFAHFALLIAVLAISTSALAGSLVGYVPGELLVVFEPQAVDMKALDGVAVKSGQSDLDLLARRFGVTEIAPLYDNVGSPDKAGGSDLRLHMSVRFAESVNLDEAQAAYAALPQVAGVWKNEIHKLTAVPDDPLLDSQWWLRNTALGGKDIRAVGGWAEATGDSNIVIAIVDSGVAWNHPDLGGTHPDKVNGAIFTNWTEYYGTTGVDDDGNGKIDDIRGWDFVNDPGAGYPDEDDAVADNDPSDYESHGTACAGCTAAITNNGLGVAGVAGGCKILPVRVGLLQDGETGGVVYMSWASAGMIYAVQMGADIINCSWGSSDYLSFATDYCLNSDVIVVTAAGNDDDQVASYLASRNGVLAVAATGEGDTKASFSSYGSWVEVSAPGVSITTTMYDRFTDSHGYSPTQGTSFSSPITCGALALIWSANPGWSDTQVINQLLNNCDNIDAANPGFEGLLGAGRVNLLKALGDSFHEVPDEFEYLIDAFNSAAPGDTIAVTAATAVSGPMILPASEFLLLGGWDDTYTSRDPVGTPTVITSNVANTALQVESGAGPDLVVDGFACTGGGGKFFNGIPDTGDFGGGILLNSTSPTLRNIEVYGNATGGDLDFGGGGGILMRDSDSLLENVHVHDNSAVYGAGVYITGGSPTLKNCVIENNDTFSLTTDSRGGGLYIVDSDVTLEGTTISGHDDVVTGGGIYAGESDGTVSLTMSHNVVSGNAAKAKGGGMFVGAGTLSMVGDEVSGNTFRPDATFMSGGGMHVENAAASLDSVSVIGNIGQSAGGLYQTGGSGLDLTNSLFEANTGLYLVGAASLQTVPAGSLIGNTVTANNSPNTSAGFNITSSNVTVSNNIVAFNTGSSEASNGFTVSGGAVSFACNDVFGNDGDQYGGIADPTGTNGNISVDPQFCDVGAGDYTIMDVSPCHVDQAGACGQIGAFGQGCSVGTAVEDDPGTGAVPLVFAVEHNFPNPFNPSTTIRFTLPEPGLVSVRIYDVAGRLVNTVLHEKREAATHEVVWSGTDDRGKPAASGVYFYRVASGDHDVVERMALVK
jgi:subtilisin family serine protease